MRLPKICAASTLIIWPETSSIPSRRKTTSFVHTPISSNASASSSHSTDKRMPE